MLPKRSWAYLPVLWRVDRSGFDGQRFQNVRELKRLLPDHATHHLCDWRGACNSAPKVEAILDRAASKGYGVKSLMQLIIESELFRNK